MTEHAELVEALLFALGKPLSRDELAQKLSIPTEDVESAILFLRERQGGLVLVDDGNTVALRTAPQAADLIEKLRKEEYARDIGRAGLETLAAIMYRGPLSRSEIDFIRGVNSSQTLRTLTMRGLVRRTPHPTDARTLRYEPTVELLSQLGVAHITDLPDYAATRERLSQLEVSYRSQLEVSEEEPAP